MISLKRMQMIGLLVVISALVLAALLLRPTGALAVAPAVVTPLDQADLSLELRAIVRKVIAIEKVDPASVFVVAPAAGAGREVGLFVGRDSSDSDVAAAYSADGMTNFQPADSAARAGGVLVFPSASGGSGIVLSAALVGFSTAETTTVTLELADGEHVAASLVAAGGSGAKFFAYSATDSTRFAVSYSAYDSGGRLIKQEDVSRAVSMPCMTSSACSPVDPP